MVLLVGTRHFMASQQSFAHEQTSFNHEQPRLEQPSFDHDQTLRWNSRKHPSNSKKAPGIPQSLRLRSCGRCMWHVRDDGGAGASHPCVHRRRAQLPTRNYGRPSCVHASIAYIVPDMRDVRRICETYTLLCTTCVRNMIS